MHGQENNSYHDNVFGSIPLHSLGLKKRNHCSFCWSTIFIFDGSHVDVVITSLDDVVDDYTPVVPPIAKTLEPTFNYISHRCTGTWNLKHEFQFQRHRIFNGVWSLTFLNACSVAKEIMLSSCKMFSMVYLRMFEDV